MSAVWPTAAEHRDRRTDRQPLPAPRFLALLPAPGRPRSTRPCLIRNHTPLGTGRTCAARYPLAVRVVLRSAGHLAGQLLLGLLVGGGGRAQLLADAIQGLLQLTGRGVPLLVQLMKGRRRRTLP